MKKMFLALAASMLSFSLFAEETTETSSSQASQEKTPVVTTKISGFVIGEYNYTSLEGAKPDNTLSLRIARVTMAGRILDDFNYRLQIQVNGTSNSISGPRIVDAFIEWDKYKAFCVKFGQFKRAFTFENPMNPIDQGFYGYSLSTSKLAGMNDRVGEHASNGRDLGLQFQGDLFEIDNHPFIHYQVGLYNGQGINVKDANSHKDLIGGLWFIPVKGARIGMFGWDGRYTRGDVTLKRQRYAISGEYLVSDWTFRSEYVHSYGYAFKTAYGSSDVSLNEVLGDKSDAWYAAVIAPVVKNVFHLKARYDVYRDNASWDRCYTAYDFGADYQFTKNLVISGIYSFVNDRRLEEGKHNYSTADLQISFRF